MRRSPREVPAGQALVVIAIALLVASVVNGRSVHRVAEGQPYGPARDVALVLSTPGEVLAERLGFGAPRRLAEAATGRKPSPAGSRFGSGVPLERADAPAPGAQPRTGATDPSPVDEDPGRVVDGVAPAPPAPVAPIPRVPTRIASAEEPVRVLFAGDSLVSHVAIGFGRAMRQDPRITVEVEFRVATGLARPDVLDWPSHLHALIEGWSPDVVVLLFGANDDQDLRTDEGRAVLLGDAWRAEYARRIGVMMDLAAADGRHVVWLALPAMPRDGLEQARLVINDLAGREAVERDRVSIVELDRILAPDGHAAYVGGTRVRERDGIHMTIAGGGLAAGEIRDTFASDYALD